MKPTPINNIEHPNRVADEAWMFEHPDLVADDAWMFDTGARPCPAVVGVRPLTDIEASSVEVVTIGESTRHRRWPREVIDTFLTAEVDRPHRQEVR